MFNRLYRLSQAAKIGGAVLMSALLLWATSGVQVVSQQAQLPTRNQIVQGLEARLATLTASEGDILDVESAAFYSDPGVLAMALIPNHVSSRSWQLVLRLIQGEEVGAVPIGALYLEGDWPDPDFPLKAGLYTIKLKSDFSVVAVAEGKEVEIPCGCWTYGPPPTFRGDQPPPLITSFSVGYQPEATAAILDSLNLLTFLTIVSLLLSAASLAATIYFGLNPPKCGGGLISTWE